MHVQPKPEPALTYLLPDVKTCTGLFQAQDKDNSGKLEAREVLAMCEQLGHTLKES